MGKLKASPAVMAGHCLTMVSPAYPPTAGDSPTAAIVVVRVVIWKSGNVTPLRAISGPQELQDEAMNTVRLWRYKPYARDGGPLDVTTDIQVEFDPAKPGGVDTHRPLRVVAVSCPDQDRRKDDQNEEDNPYT